MKYMKLTAGLLPVMTIALFLSCNKTKTAGETSVSDTKTSATASGKIVYVEIDTIMSHYEMAKDIAATMEGKSKSLDADLKSKSNTLQAAGLDFQNKVQKGLLTQAQAQEMQQQLAGSEQNLYQLRDQYRAQMADEASVNQRKIINSIMEYLKEYNKTKGYQYILANQFPSSILYADSSLNITNDVIGGLNAKYKAEKGKSKK